MKGTISTIALGSLLLISFPSFAEHRESADRGMRGGRDFSHERQFPREREVWRGDRRTLDVWRGGNWHHGRHEGRDGWWWIVGGIWYFYPVPVYPYPDPFTPPAVIINQQPQTSEPPVTAEVPPQPQYWYYCDSRKAYYPYVSTCPESWRAVPAEPPVPSQAPQQH